jgi:protein involved in polysaccharide export with SLBB domain
MLYSRTAIMILLSIIFLSLSGCFSSNPEDIEAFIKPDAADTTCDKYILQPPDVVKVYCTKVAEINNQQQQIRPDGKISYESIGEVQAAGKTPAELTVILREKILELYKAQLIDEKSIDLRVEAFQSKRYYVLGEVYSPGPKLYTGRDTVLFALAQARLSPTAWPDRVQVIRPSSEEGVKPYIFEVNFNRMSAHGDTTKNVMLQEGDIIYVPPTVLAWIAMRIEEVLRPIARALSLIYVVDTQGEQSGYYRNY